MLVSKTRLCNSLIPSSRLLVSVLLNLCILENPSLDKLGTSSTARNSNKTIVQKSISGHHLKMNPKRTFHSFFISIKIFFHDEILQTKSQRRKLKLSFLPFNFYLQFLFSSLSFILLTEESKWKEKKNKTFSFFRRKSFKKTKKTLSYMTNWRCHFIVIVSTNSS